MLGWRRASLIIGANEIYYGWSIDFIIVDEAFKDVGVE